MNPFPTFKEIRELATTEAHGRLRAGWQADYPSLYNFLGPLYRTGAGSNDGGYRSPDSTRRWLTDSPPLPWRTATRQSTSPRNPAARTAGHSAVVPGIQGGWSTASPMSTTVGTVFRCTTTSLASNRETAAEVLS